MTTTLALERLFDAVASSFAADGIIADNMFGWRIPAQPALRRARLAWVPGDTGGVLGVTGPARNPGGLPRSLATLGELFTVYISNQDPSAPEDERKQYHLTRLLRDAWYRAVYRVSHGTFVLHDEAWLNEKNERRYGATLRLVCEIQAMVPDALPDELLNGGVDPNDTLDAVQNAIDEGTTLIAEVDEEED